MHSERGPESYELQFRLIAGHDRFHLEQMRKTLASVKALPPRPSPAWGEGAGAEALAEVDHHVLQLGVVQERFHALLPAEAAALVASKR